MKPGQKKSCQEIGLFLVYGEPFMVWAGGGRPWARGRNRMFSVSPLFKGAMKVVDHLATDIELETYGAAGFGKGLAGGA